MITKNTIEEKIIKLHEQKKDLANAVISGQNIKNKNGITNEELLNLLRF